MEFENVVSAFDGIACGKLALDRAGARYLKYSAAEIDHNALSVSKYNHSDINYLGDVRGVSEYRVGAVDLLMGGSPCQGFSKAGNKLNFDDPRSELFFEFVRLLDELKPKYFLLENVRMKGEWRDIITSYVGVKPVLINSNLVSAQNRPRYYWTNIPFTMPEDRGITLESVVEPDAEPISFTEVRTEEAKAIRRENMRNGRDYNPMRGKILVPRSDGKANCLTASPSDKEHSVKLKGMDCSRRMTPLEWERLQTLPDGYTKILANNQRYKVIGNAWTVDVVAHIFRGTIK